MTESMTDLLVCGAELYMLWDLGRNLLRVNEKRTSVRTAGIAMLYAAFVAANSADSSFLNFMVVPVIYILRDLFPEYRGSYLFLGNCGTDHDDDGRLCHGKVS